MPSIYDVLKGLKAANILIDQQRCVRVRNKNASCRACADACPSGCISYQDNELSIAPELCIGCATCASACPSDALQPKKPTDAELCEQCLRAAAANDGCVVVACQPLLDRGAGLYDAVKVAAVPCLGRVDTSLLVCLVACGAADVLLVSDECDACDSCRGSAVCDEAVASANVVLETWRSPACVRRSRKLPGSVRAAVAPDCDEGKRAFLLSAKDGAVEAAGLAAQVAVEDALGVGAAASALTPLVRVDEQGTLPQSVSPRRSALLDSLRMLEGRFGQPEDVMIDTRLWSQVLIDVDACMSCRMCATFCPTGANFKFETDEGRLGVKHQVAKCVRCGLCADICPRDALSYSEKVFARDVAEGAIETFVLNGAFSNAKRDSIYESMKGRFVKSGVRIGPA